MYTSELNWEINKLINWNEINFAIPMTIILVTVIIIGNYRNICLKSTQSIASQLKYTSLQLKRKLPLKKRKRTIQSLYRFIIIYIYICNIVQNDDGWTVAFRLAKPIYIEYS